MPDSADAVGSNSPEEAPNLNDSIPFDPFRRPSGETLLVMERLFLEVLERTHGSSPRQSSREQVKACLEALLSNLIAAENCSSGTYLAVPLGSAAFTVRGQEQYAAHGLGYDNFKRTYEFLTEGSDPYVKEWEGFHDPITQVGRVTRVKATPKLWSRLSNGTSGQSASAPLPNTVSYHETKPVIVVRNEDKQQVPYEETPEVSAMAERLLNWNQFLQKQWIDLRLTDQEFATGFSELPEENEGTLGGDTDSFRPLHLNLSRNWLYRVFRPGFQEHGRFYGGWWQEIPSQFRKRITINWYPCTEVDFSEMQAHMLYAMVGQQPPAECYKIEEEPDIPREVVKKAFFKIINALRGQQVRPADPATLPDGLSWSELLELLRRKHAPIAQYFNTGIGLSLMRKDSEIADIVMQSLMRRNILALPVHDSFLIRQSYVHRLKDEMKAAYRQVMGQGISLSVEPPFRDPIEGPVRPISSIEQVERIFQGEEDEEWISGPYRSYYLRREKVRNSMPREYHLIFNPR